jgi:Ferritin-like domain
MANQETQILDDIIVKSRRKMLTLGAASLASMAAGAFAPKAASAATTYTDADILNFALKLEYLEANFYYLAAFGTTIDVANSASTTAGAPLIVLNQTIGTKGSVTGGSKVPFANTLVGAYATETAVEEGKHVKFLQGALTTAAVAQPAINLSASAGGAWPTLATAAGVAGGATFSPYASDAAFLVGAYVFEDVGVTAYHGAASLITQSGNLSAAAGILAVEAYHAGLVRTTINALDPVNASGYLTITAQISALRATLAKAGLLGMAPGATSYDTTNDDYGLASTSGTLSTVTLGSSTSATATNIVDCDLNASDSIAAICFGRNTTQVLNIVTGGGAVNAGGTAAVSPATGVFFPAGLNGLFK